MIDVCVLVLDESFDEIKESFGAGIGQQGVTRLFVVIFNVHVRSVFVENVEERREIVVIHTFDQSAPTPQETHGVG